MRRRIEPCLLPALLICLPAFNSRAEEAKIPVRDLPKAVREAAKAKFPKAEIAGAAREVEGGKTTYEVLFKLKGRSIDVSMAADGTILEIEKEIDADDLPRAVKVALAAKYPKAKIQKIEQVSKGEDGPVSYEMVVASEVVVDAKGRFKEAGKGNEGGKEPSAKLKKREKDDEENEDEDEDDDDKPKKGDRS